MSNVLAICKQCARQAFVRGGLFLLGAAAVFVLAVGALFLVFRFVDPPGSAVMLADRLGGREVRRAWVDYEAISPALIKAVVNSEDARFCRHFGIDPIELEIAFENARRRGGLDVRGASTISMQVVKNLMLWRHQSLLRKGLEFAITPIMEVVWPKRRILEVYLNVAEWAPGVYGIEAAARHHFKKSARRLTTREAALLAAALPNPKLRRAGRPGPKTRRRANQIRRRTRAAALDLSCLKA
ncbi:MAG: monofunctional biosynthetic peptidoglycan transglycosylase [Pseudomonadota bacterium]